MEIAYVCEWEKRPKSNHCPSIPLVCAWSCRNLIAFTTDLKNEEDDKGKEICLSWEFYVQNNGLVYKVKYTNLIYNKLDCECNFAHLRDNKYIFGGLDVHLYNNCHALIYQDKN